MLTGSDCTISIIGELESPGQDAETFELITEGKFSRKGGVTRISYVDSGVTGESEPSETIFVVEPSRITLTRGAWFGADMVFEEREKHHFLYQTQFAAFIMGVRTEDMRRNLTADGGSLYIKYTLLDVDDDVYSRNSLKIEVTATGS